MRILLFALVLCVGFTFVQTNSIPACCVTSHNYTENITVATGFMGLQCQQCNDSVTVIGNFSELTSVSFSFSLTISCNDCPGLLYMGLFPKFHNFTYGQVSLSFSCTNCPLLKTLVSMPVATVMPYSDMKCDGCPSLTSMVHLPVAVDTSDSLTATCISCSSLITMVQLPLSIAVGANGQLIVTCTSCTSLEKVVSLPKAIIVALVTVTCNDCPSLIEMSDFISAVNISTFSGLQFTCNNCTSLQTMANLPAAEVVGSSYFNCDNCPSLVTLGSFPSAIYIDYTGTCIDCISIEIMSNFSLFSPLSVYQYTAYCTNCPSLTQFNSFTIQNLAGTSNYVEHCTFCPSLPRMADFSDATFVLPLTLYCKDCPRLSVMGNFSVASNMTGFVYIECINCPLLTEILYMPQVESVNIQTFTYMTTHCFNCPKLTRMFDAPLLRVVDDAWHVEVVCENCSSLISLLEIPSLQTIYTIPSSNSTLETIQFFMNISCTNCLKLATLANFAALESPSVAVSGPFPFILTFCDKCPSLTTFGVEVPATQMNKNFAYHGFQITCIDCPALSHFYTVGYYYLEGILPADFLTFPNGASLVLANSLNDSTFSFPSASRLVDLTITNTNFTNMNPFAHISFLTSLTINYNNKLENVDAFQASLRSVQSVTITYNPALCNIDVPFFNALSVQLPTISNNFAGSSCPQSTRTPVTPPAPTLVSLYPTGAVLNLTNPNQPSILAQYSLYMNGILVASYPAYNPLSVYQVTTLTQLQQYSFALSVEVDGLIAQGSALTITTPQGFVVQGCAAGQILDQNKHCVNCGPAQFPSTDTSCASCPPGTFSADSALTSSGQCLLCPQGTYNSKFQQSSCAPCPNGTSCLIGAIVPAAKLSSLSDNNSTNSFDYGYQVNITDANGNQILIMNVLNTDIGGIQLGWIYLIAFISGCVLLLIPLLLFAKTLRPFVTPLAFMLRVPIYMMQVPWSMSSRGSIVNEGTLMLPVHERGSFLRGVVGALVVLGVLLVTAYQIQMFVQFNTLDLTAVQPGLLYSNNEPVQSSVTAFNLQLNVSGTPVTCDYPRDYSWNVDFMNNQGQINAAYSLSGSSIGCAYDFATSSVLLTYSSPSKVPLAVFSICKVTLTSTTSSPVWFGSVSYQLNMSTFHNYQVTATQAIAKNSTTEVFQSVNFKTSAVGTEYITYGQFDSTGFLFSPITVDQTLTGTPSSSATVYFTFVNPGYTYQIRRILSTDGLQFVSALLAIGAGVVSVGAIVSWSFYNIRAAFRSWNRDHNRFSFSERLRAPSNVSLKTFGV